jgi:hypothetical protein
VAARRRGFAVLSVAFPVLRAFSALDTLLPFQSGYKLIVRAVRTGVAAPDGAGRS